jgi:putative ABC transport system substrate-binding protein
MRDRRGIALACALALGLSFTPLAAAAQPATRLPRVGYLTSGSPPARTIGAFRQGLRDLGWSEGQNIAVDYRFAEGRQDRLADLAADLVRLRVDVIVAGGTVASTAAKSATRTIPIVMIGAGDPVNLGLVASLARPGGNVTGSSFTSDLEMYGKALELLKETLPKVRRVAVLSNPANPSTPLVVARVKAAARSLGVQLQTLDVREPDELDRAFAGMARERAGALFVVSDAMFSLNRARLADLVARHRLPSMHGFREFVEAGGLMSYGPSLDALFRRAAFFVDRILKGAQPADLPVEQPATFELVVNLATARALGLTIPRSVLLRADQVIE